MTVACGSVGDCTALWEFMGRGGRGSVGVGGEALWECGGGA